MDDNNSNKMHLHEYNADLYQKPSVTVDVLIFTIDDDVLKLVLIRRDEMPYKEKLSLPGSFVGIDETLDEAAYRTIMEEIRCKEIYLEQLYTWGEIERDPRMRVITVSYIAIVPFSQLIISKGKRVSEVVLFPVIELLNEMEELAFDHMKMVKYACERIKNKVEYSKIAFQFVDEEFTLSQLQKVYEILLNKQLYKANFRKKIKDSIEETDKMTENLAHRPSKYYRLRGSKDE